jgi:hypothetical protein
MIVPKIGHHIQQFNEYWGCALFIRTVIKYETVAELIGMAQRKRYC